MLMEKYFHNILTDLGLSEDEASVYEALLELGQSAVSPIATLAKVSRTNCYNILESLVQKRMIKKAKFRGKLAYDVDDPMRIITNLEEEIKQIDVILKKAKIFQPELTRRYAKNILNQ